MKIVFFEPEGWMKKYIPDTIQGHELVFIDGPLTPDNASDYQDADIISVFVFSKVNTQVIETLSNLKLIAVRSTGFDHIDLVTAKDKGIIVTNVPRYGSATVAEHTWALVLTLSRMIYRSYEQTEKVDFSNRDSRGFDLENKTLGLVGLGEIGSRVAEMSRGFKMKLRVFTRTKNEEWASTFPSCVFVDQVQDLYSHSDVISFHTPLTPETHHILNIDNYQSLKPGSIVVNTARGGIIETQALVRALQEGIIKGAGLDVLESEAAIKNEASFDPGNIPPHQELAETYLNHMLIGMDNVVITPHNAFNSQESIRRLLDGNLDNIRFFLGDNHEAMDRVGV